MVSLRSLKQTLGQLKPRMPKFTTPKFGKFNFNAVKPTKLKTLLVGATVLSVGFTAVVVYIPWKVISNNNVNDLTSKINQETAQNASLEVGLIFKSAQAAQTFLQKASDRNVMAFDRKDSVEQVFFTLLESRPNLTWVMFGYPNGNFLGIQRTGEKNFQLHQRQWNAQDGKSLHTTSSYEVVGENLRLIKQDTETDKKPFYAPDRPWYKSAKATPNQTTWTTYVRRTNNQATLDSAITFNKNDQMMGVLNLGFDLDQISRSLQYLQKDKKNALFITNSKAQLLASSDLQDATPKQIPGQDEPQLNTLSTSSNPLIQGIAKELKNKNITLQEQTSQNFRYRDPKSGETSYVNFIPLNRLDWVIGIVTPESLYLGDIRRNEVILSIAILGFILLTLVLSIHLANRVIIQPILKLNTAARKVATQNFSEEDLKGVLDRPDELGELALVINEMAQQVDGREQGLRNQMKKLKQETEKIQRENASANANANASDGTNNPYLLIQRAKDLRRALEHDESKLV